MFSNRSQGRVAAWRYRMTSAKLWRSVSAKEYCHDRMGEAFAQNLSEYDTLRRVEVLVDGFLGDVDLAGMTVLDVGCGLGFFSNRLSDRGARVTACDIGPQMVEITGRRCGCEAVVGDALHLSDIFGDARFDVVVSSECIEHTPDPSGAVKQMIAVLKPGGILSLSTPNVCWAPLVKLATALKVREFDGLENFCSWRGLRETLMSNGVAIVAEKGIHLFPFQIPFHSLSRWCDDHCQWLKGVMINICIAGRKT